jgi:hypothetical protein
VLEVVDETDTSGFRARHPQAGPGLRAFNPDLRIARAEERRGQRDAYVESLRDRPRDLYAPDARSPRTDRYVLANDDDLSGSLAEVMRSEQSDVADPQKEASHLSSVTFPSLSWASWQAAPLAQCRSRR